MKQRLYQRWENYSSKEKIFLMGLATAGMLILIWCGLLSPLMDYQQKGKEKMNKAAEDYLWMADNATQFGFITLNKETAQQESLVQQVTRALKKYKPPLTINVVNEQQLTLTAGDDPIDFLALMRFLIYLQADYNIQVEDIDLAAVKGNSSLVLINRLLIGIEEEYTLRKQEN
ncbi:type II secretion system protein M [Erwinia sp. D4-22]